MLEIGREMRRSEFVRLRWTLKPSEVNWKQFIEGKHMANHFSNSKILTEKFNLFETVNNLNKLMG